MDDNYSGDLYVSLLDSFAMLLLTVVQIGFLSDLATQLARKEEFVRAARASGSVSASIRGRRGVAIQGSLYDTSSLAPGSSDSAGHVDQEATLQIDADEDVLRTDDPCMRFLYSAYDWYRKVAFYHSGKLTLLLAFVVATLQDTVTGTMLAVGSTIFAAVMTYRQDPAGLDTSCLNYVLTCRCLCCCCWLCSTQQDQGVSDADVTDRRRS